MKNSILIVDDQAKNLQLIATVLKEDYNLFLSDNGKHSLKIANEKKPDLIILDIMMPGLSGFDVCDLLKSNPNTADIPVIFLTAKADEESVIKAFEMGAVDYINKPFNQKEILVRIKNHIDLQIFRQNLKEKNKNLEKADAEKNKLLSILGHDLKSPFTIIMGYTELLENYKFPEEFSKVTKIIRSLKETTVKTYDLLDDLLQWAKFLVGKGEINKEFISLAQMIEEIIPLVYESIKQKKINLEIDLDKEANCLVDPYLLKTVVRNLLSNAVKFTPSKGEIKISLQKKENKIIISIEDNGVGISEDKLDKIFRLDLMYTTKGTDGEHGTGLGLVICQDFIAKMNGKILLYSQENKGSKFIIELPVLTNDNGG